MTNSLDFIISFPVDDNQNFVVDPNGDTMPTFREVYIEGKSAGSFSFQVSSVALQRESAFLKTHSKDFWAPALQGDGKLHMSTDFEDAELVGVLILLTTMHHDFATRTGNGFLPCTVSMATLYSIIRMAYFFLVRSAGDLLQNPTVRWLNTFKRDDG
jgi:hypothetical protein